MQILHIIVIVVCMRNSSLNAQTKRLKISATPELVKKSKFSELRLFNFVNWGGDAKKSFLGIHLTMSKLDEHKWVVDHVYKIKDLLDYAKEVNQEASVHLSQNLKPESDFQFLPVDEAFEEAIGFLDKKYENQLQKAREKYELSLEEYQWWKAEKEELIAA